MILDLFDRSAYAPLGLSQDAEQLVFDVFTMTPQVPNALLARVPAPPADGAAPVAAWLVVDTARALAFVPEIAMTALAVQPPQLTLREDLVIAEPILVPEIER